MKINDIKHNHSLTDLLKVLLFSILMLAPFCSVAVRSLYVICNKNAYQSYSSELVQQQVEIQQGTDLINYESYLITYNGTNTGSATYYFDDIELPFDFNLQNANMVSLYNSNSNIYFYYYDGTNNNWVGSVEGWGSQYFSITIQAYEYRTGYNKANANTNVYTYLFVPQKLDNVFEYSVSKLADDQLFNWTQQTAVFSPVESMCTNLGITNQVIPQILVYWFLLSVIYVIIDIILKSFTALTHMLGSKKA